MLHSVEQMIQLSFQPALDPLHAAFRLLRIRSILIPRGPLEIDHVRILDFYLSFPFRIVGVRLKQGDSRLRALARKYANHTPYGEQPDDRSLLVRMRPMQLAALETLSAKFLIDGDLLETGKVQVTQTLPPAGLMTIVDETNAQDEQLLTILDALAAYELHGPDGLKARSGLLEHRYDAI